MRALARPNPEFEYNSGPEIMRLRGHRDRAHEDRERSRNIPDPTDGHVLIASWNIANLGLHKRRPADLRVIAEMLSWFEIVAVQEVADNLADFMFIMNRLGPRFGYVFSDRGGNNERAAYVYDTTRVSLGPKLAEVVIVESDRVDVKLPRIDRKFHGFNRNPYLATFGVEDRFILLANCHLLFGPSGSTAEKRASIEKRQLEAYAIARWCDLRRNNKHAFTEMIMALGDFNLPHREDGDPIYEALTSRGLTFPPHETRIPTNVSRSHDYDQILVVPKLSDHIADIGVFDFDDVIFPSLYTDDVSYWRRCTKYYISDHRPVWMQLSLDPIAE